MAGRRTGADPASPLETFYFLNDHLGTPQKVIDLGGNLVWEGRAFAFGDTQVQAGNLVENNLRFPGQISDAETGMHYNFMRTYDPRIGAYPQADPIGLEGGINRFAYANGNPIVLGDPTGEIVPLAAMALGAVMGGGFDFVFQLVAHDGNLECVDWYQVGGAAALGAAGAYGIDKGAKLFSAWRRARVAGTSTSELSPFRQRYLSETGGRLGNQATRQHVDQVATEMERRGWTVIRGGGRAPEEFLPGPGGARTGSSYPDITAIKNGRTLRVNTVDTYADGMTSTAREATNAARIRAQTGEHLLLIPKP